MLETFTDSLILDLQQLEDLLPRLLFGILIIILFYLIGKLISKIYDRVLQKTPLSRSNLEYFQKLIIGISVFIGFIFCLNIIGFHTFAASRTLSRKQGEDFPIKEEGSGFFWWPRTIVRYEPIVKEYSG